MKSNNKAMEESAKRILKDGLPKIDIVSYMKEFLSSSWIPITEPPKEDGRYLVNTVYKEVSQPIDIFYYFKGNWMDHDGFEYDEAVVTHWMPLPDKPKVQ